jgi:hypothetical protein
VPQDERKRPLLSTEVYGSVGMTDARGENANQDLVRSGVVGRDLLLD